MTLLTGAGLGGGGLILPVVAGAAGNDVDVDTFFGVMDAAGESYLASEVTMINNLVTTLKNDGVWDLFTVLWFPVGAGVDEAMRAFKHPNGIGTAMTNNGPFTDADWNRNTGLNGEGKSNAFFIDTLTTEADYAPNSDTHILAISETASAAGLTRDIGTATTDRFQLIIKITPNSGGFFRTFTPNTGVENATVAAHDGVFVGTRKDSVAYFYRDATLAASTSRTGVDSSTTEPITIFKAVNNSSNKRFSGVSLGKGITPANHALIEAAFQSARAERASIS